MSNVHGLFSKKKAEDDDDDDQEDTNNRFVGGIDSRGGGSGLAVEPNNDVDAVFGLAGSASAGEERPRRTITMYRDGFVVDDGPYRRVDDPANADFLKSLAMGRTPKELIPSSEQGGGESDVTVGLIDKRSEEYEETFTSFSGEGNSLGTSTAAAGASTSQDGVVDPSALPPPVETNDAEPTTSIQVRLLNGQRRVIRINTTSTVLNLASMIVGGDSATTSSFTLVSGFPPKPITDLSQTIDEAGLKGAQVTQKSA